MKKPFLLLTALFVILFQSCSSDENEFMNQEMTTLEFSTFNEGIEQAEFIEKTFLLKEAALFNGLKIESNNSLSKNTNLSFDEIKEDLESVQKRRIEIINQIRKEFNFVSIKSIADEINSLRLVNPKMAEELFTKHKDLLIEGKFGVKSIFDNVISNVINSQGVLKIDNEILGNSVISSENGYNESAKNFLFGECSQEDILVQDGPYTITWHAGNRLRSGTFITKKHNIYAQFGSFIRLPNGIYLPWGSRYIPGAGSYAEFVAPNPDFDVSNPTTNPIDNVFLEFPNGNASTVVSNEENTKNGALCMVKTVISPSTFHTIVGDVVLTAQTTNTLIINN